MLARLGVLIIILLEHNKDLHNFCTIKMCRIITIVFYGYQILLAVQLSTKAIPFSPNIMLKRANVYYIYACRQILSVMPVLTALPVFPVIPVFTAMPVFPTMPVFTVMSVFTVMPVYTASLETHRCKHVYNDASASTDASAYIIGHIRILLF